MSLCLLVAPNAAPATRAAPPDASRGRTSDALVNMRHAAGALRARALLVGTAHHVQVLFGLALVASAFVPVLVYAMASLDRVAKAEASLVAVYTRSMVLAQDLRSEKLVQNATMADFVLSGDQGDVRRHEAASAAFDGILARIRALHPEPELAASLDRISALEARLRAFEAPGIRMRSDGATPKETDAYFRREAVAMSQEVTSEIDGVVTAATSNFEADDVRNGAMVGTVHDVLACASVLTAVLCAVLLGLTARVLSRKRDADAMAEVLARREREVSAARRDAVEMVAHDLRSPLSVVTLGAEMVRRRSGLADDHKAMRYVDKIVQAADSMERMIGDILVNSRIEAGTLVVAREPVEVIPFVEGLVSHFALIGAHRQVDVSADLSEAPATVTMDAPRMGQVLSNLMGNAVKFSPTGGRITLSVRIRSAHVDISVADQGPGMTQEQCAMVFDRHWQAAGTASMGTGLGMSIARSLTEAHGGTLRVRSTPGAGTTFTVSLPLREDVRAVA